MFLNISRHTKLSFLTGANQPRCFFKEAHEKNTAIYVIKNNRSYVVILPYELYLELVGKVRHTDDHSKEGK